MKGFQRNSMLLVLGIAVIVCASLAYLLTAGRTSLRQAGLTPTAVPHTPLAELAESSPAKPCNAKQRDFEAGVAFPQWTQTGYGENDAKWLTELPAMLAQTATCWVEMPLLFDQASLSSTTVTQGPTTPSVSSFNYGVRLAHALGMHVYVTPLLQVDGPQPWAGAIKFATYQQQQQWFESYWLAIRPYAVTAAQDSVEQFAMGTEEEWLQENAPASLWDGLIADLRGVYAGTLTYDMNWDVLQKRPPAWMRNPALKMIGVSAYLPLVDTPVRVDPKHISGLWQQTVKHALDDFAVALGEPIFISEIGYRNSADALYHSWESGSSAPPDSAEQAAACDAALANIIPDQHILGTFFWGWDDTGAFNLKGMQAATIIHSYYQTLQAER